MASEHKGGGKRERGGEIGIRGEREEGRKSRTEEEWSNMETERTRTWEDGIT
jgi:hypothetical protein